MMNKNCYSILNELKLDWRSWRKRLSFKLSIVNYSENLEIRDLL